MSQILKTERLLLREFQLSDSAFILALLNSPGWLQFIGDRNVKDEHAAKEYLVNGPIKSYKENGFGLWLVETLSDSAAIGMCGIIKRDTLPHPDIGFAYLPEHAGQGYALEAARAVLNFAGNNLQLPIISAITLPDNIRSISLLEKIGLSFNRIIVFPGSREELLLFDNEKKMLASHFDNDKLQENQADKL